MSPPSTPTSRCATAAGGTRVPTEPATKARISAIDDLRAAGRVGDPQEEWARLGEVGVPVADDRRDAAGEVLAHLERRRLLHPLAVQGERSDRHVRAREDRKVRIRRQRPVRPEVVRGSVRQLAGPRPDDVHVPSGLRGGDLRDVVHAVPRRPRMADEHQARPRVRRGREGRVVREADAVRDHDPTPGTGPEPGGASELSGDEDQAGCGPEQRVARGPAESAARARRRAELGDVVGVDLDHHGEPPRGPDEPRVRQPVPCIDDVRAPPTEVARQRLARSQRRHGLPWELHDGRGARQRPPVVERRPPRPDEQPHGLAAPRPLDRVFGHLPVDPGLATAPEECEIRDPHRPSRDPIGEQPTGCVRG